MLPSQKMASATEVKEVGGSASVTEVREVGGSALPPEGVTPKPSVELLSHSAVDQLVLAAKVDNAVHKLIQRLKVNMEILKKLVKIPGMIRC